MLTQDIAAPSSLHGGGMSMHVGTSSSQPPLSSIAERRSDSGEDTEDEDAVEGGWKTADVRTKPRNSGEESVIKAGYLWKKGERRKVCMCLIVLYVMRFLIRLSSFAAFRLGKSAGLYCARRTSPITKVRRSTSCYASLSCLMCIRAPRSI